MDGDALLVRSEASRRPFRLADTASQCVRPLRYCARRQAALEKIQTSLPLVRQQENNFKALSDQGFVASHAALAETRNSKAAYLAETGRQLSAQLAQARLKTAQLQQETAKTERKEQLTRLIAPVNGTVQQLAIYTAGGGKAGDVSLHTLWHDTGHRAKFVVRCRE